MHKFKIMDGVDKTNIKIIEDKIMKILSSPNLSYDNDHALVLCQLHNFLKGTLYLYDRKGLHHQILKIHMEMNDIEAALDTCRQFGPQNPNLWVQALQLVGMTFIFFTLRKVQKFKALAKFKQCQILQESVLCI